MDLDEIKVNVIQLTDLETNDRRVQLGVWAVFVSLFFPLEKQTNSLKLGSIYRIFRRILITKIVSLKINLNTGHKRDRRDHIDGNKSLSSLCCYSFARFSIIFPCNKLHKPSTPTAACSRVLAWRMPGSEQPRHCCLWGRTESDMTEATQQWQQYPNTRVLFQCISFHFPHVSKIFHGCGYYIFIMSYPVYVLKCVVYIFPNGYIIFQTIILMSIVLC